MSGSMFWNMPAGEPKAPILVVDDDAQLRAAVAGSLRNAGYEVAVASNGREALQIYSQAHNSIRLVITDVQMPFLSGIELANAMQASGTGCPLLLISAAPLPPESKKPGWEFLSKPFTRQALLLTVKRLLATALV